MKKGASSIKQGSTPMLRQRKQSLVSSPLPSGVKSNVLASPMPVESPARSTVICIPKTPDGAAATSATSPSTTSSEQSSLAGTKQWVDEVLCASVRVDDDETKTSSSSVASPASIVFHSDDAQTNNCNATLETSGSSDEDDEDDTFRANESVFDHHGCLLPGSVINDAVGGGRKPSSVATAKLLATQELFALYTLLDMDGDGVVSTMDLYAFIAMHPQALDVAVSTMVQSPPQGSKHQRRNHRHREEAREAYTGGMDTLATATSIPVVIPIGEMSVLGSCPKNHRTMDACIDRVSSLWHPQRLSTAKEVDGRLWWVRQRHRADEMARRFVSFVIHMAVSLAVSSSRNSGAGSSSSPISGGGGMGGAGIRVQRASATTYLSFYSFQQLYYESSRLLKSDDTSQFVLVVLDVPMLQQVLWFFEFLHTFAKLSGKMSVGGIVHEDMDSSSSPGLGGGTNSDSRYVRNLESSFDQNGEAARGKVPLDQAAAQALLISTRAKMESATRDGSATGIPLPIMTCLPAVYWTFAAWDSQRGFFDVSVLQRLGERYLKYKAFQYSKSMRQLLRHLWVAQRSHTGSASAARRSRPSLGQSVVSWHSGEEDRDGGLMSPKLQRQLEDSITRRRARGGGSATTANILHRQASDVAAAAVAPRKVSSTVAEELALMQLSHRFLSFHGIRDVFSKSSSSSSSVASFGADASQQQLQQQRSANQHISRTRTSGEESSSSDGSSSSEDLDGIESWDVGSVGQPQKLAHTASWELNSAASTQASPKHLKRRGTWRRASGSALPTAAPPSAVVTCDASSDQAGPLTAVAAVEAIDDEEPAMEAAVRQSLLSQDMVLHTMLCPEPLSMISSLCSDENTWMTKETFWCTVRAALYAVLAAVVIGSCDLFTQSWLLGASPFDGFGFSLSSVKNIFVVPEFGSILLLPSNVSSSSSSPVSSDASANQTTAPTAADLISSITTSSAFTPFIKYQIIVLVVSIAVSVGEIVFLYLDNLQVCLGLARNAGIPLDAPGSQRGGSVKRHDLGSATFMIFSDRNVDIRGSGHALLRGGGGEDMASGGSELHAIRSNLGQRRAQFLIAAISRCALQLRFNSRTVFGVDVRDRNISRFRLALQEVGERFRRVAPSLFLRVIASRLLSRFLVPFLATPLMVYWNCTLTRQSLYKARAVVLGTLAVEHAVTELLSSLFTAPARYYRHNEGILSSNSSTSTSVRHKDAGKRLNGNSKRGGGQSPRAASHYDEGGIEIIGSHMYLNRPLFHAPFHVLREMIMMVLFFAHAIEPGVAHPVLHCLLVQLVTSCEVPDVCMWMTPRKRMPKSSLRSKATQQRERSTAPVRDVDAASAIRTAVSDQPPDYNNNTNTATPATTGTQHMNKYVEAVLLDVGGGCNSAMSAWLRLFVREINTLRQETNSLSSDAEWLKLYVDHCPWPSDVEDRVSLQRHPLWHTIAHSKAKKEAKMRFMMESLFPSWASSAMVGPLRRSKETKHKNKSARRGAESQADVAYSDATLTTDDDVDDYEQNTRQGRDDCSSTMDTVSQSEPAPRNNGRPRGTPYMFGQSSATADPTLLPFQAEHIKGMLSLVIILSVTTTIKPKRVSTRVHCCMLLTHVHRAYYAALSREEAGGMNSAAAAGHPLRLALQRLWSNQATQKLLQEIDTLHDMYWEGCPVLHTPTVYRIIDMCSGLS